ncbi:MAG TPA: hypothetical protein VK604_22270, partial [Bryobacteraceae bacterium]|nr:hypothetical protein [Bryobacteraceae bacterium]
RMGAPELEVAAAVNDLTRYLLFVDEPPLAAPVVGVSTFSKTFPQQGPHDRLGRSLRDFNLHTRIFRYRLSYTIYSPAFDHLPDPARRKVYERLHDALTDRVVSGHIPEQERTDVVSILLDTKPEAALYFRRR